MVIVERLPVPVPAIVCENSATWELGVSARQSVIELLPVMVSDWRIGDSPACAGGECEAGAVQCQTVAGAARRTEGSVDNPIVARVVVFVPQRQARVRAIDNDHSLAAVAGEGRHDAGVRAA